MTQEPTQAPLSEVEAERLSLIRYQVLAATEATTAPPPISTLAINSMQDAAEATLWASGERVLADIPRRAEFDKLFDAVCTKLGEPEEISGLRSAAIAMNNARVGFKHHGNQVPEATLRRHLDATISLVEALVARAFGIQLSDVSMLLFVRDQQARSLIEKAEKEKDAGDLIQALFLLRLAFDRVVYEYQHRKTLNGHRTIFTTKPSFFPMGMELRDAGLEEVAKWIENIDNLVRLGALGVNLQRYSYFNAVAPGAMYFVGDHPAQRMVGFEDVAIEHYNASFKFVVDTAIRLAATDYTLRPQTWERSSAHFDPDYVPPERAPRDDQPA